MSATLNDQFERHLSLLDNAPIGDSTLFTHQRHKDHYETILAHALTKFRSAEYHLANVRAFIQIDEAEMEQAAERLGDNLEELRALRIGRAESQFAMSRSAREYGFEFSAFLVDLKTSLDFLATVAAYHLQGIDTDSISTLIKLALKGRRSKTLEIVSAWLDWLVGLRDYRHKIAHRLVIKTDTGFVIRRIGKHRPKYRLPVVVPEHSPRFVLDTRKKRFEEAHLSDDSPRGLVIDTMRATVKLDDGPEEIVHAEETAYPAPGYASIEDFMQQHLANFEAFSVELLNALGEFGHDVVK